MNGPTAPPPGSVPGGGMSPDMASMLGQMGMGNAAQTGKPGAAGAGLPGAGADPSSHKPPKPPRPIAGPVQEAKYMAQDVAAGIFEFLPPIIQTLLGKQPDDTPEETARKQEMLQRYQALNAEQQQVAAKKMQEEQHRKEQEAMEKQEKDQRAAAEQSDDVVVPQGRPRGEDAAMGSGKKRTVTKLQNDRKKLSSAG